MARWQAKLRILIQIKKILPISDVVIEDVRAETRKGCERWNSNFSPIEQGKQWLYKEIEQLGLNLHLRRGYETKELRNISVSRRLPKKISRLSHPML
jgi:hypothetical protein